MIKDKKILLNIEVQDDVINIVRDSKLKTYPIKGNDKYVQCMIDNIISCAISIDANEKRND